MTHQLKINGILLETDSISTLNDVLFKVCSLTNTPHPKQELEKAPVKNKRYKLPEVACTICSKTYHPSYRGQLSCSKVCKRELFQRKYHPTVAPVVIQ
jgi:hypothetical protein